jgi:hypothetical protein
MSRQPERQPFQGRRLDQQEVADVLLMVLTFEPNK